MLSDNANRVLRERYFLRDDEGNVLETTPDLFRRVAASLAAPNSKYGHTEAQVLAWAEEYGALLYNPDFDAPDFLPNSPTLANAGTELGQLSACFVLPVPDDMAGIFDAVKYQMLIHQTGGGTGFPFSNIREAGALVSRTKREASGPTTFGRVFNEATETIKQGGMRRGANMGILRIDHPDIMSRQFVGDDGKMRTVTGFIQWKDDPKSMTNFNISVGVTNEFMSALAEQRSYNLIRPKSKEVVTQQDAQAVFKEIAFRAHKNGEPGMVFIDRMNEYNPVPWLGEYEATNPCGEQPLLPYESCNLGSINLENFVELIEQPDGTLRAMINWPRLRIVIRKSTRMLNGVVDANKFPEAVSQLDVMNQLTRKIGLGVMGFARMLFKLGIAYGSNESLIIAEQVMACLDFESKWESMELAKEQGMAPAYVGHETEMFEFWERVLTERHRHETLRNLGVSNYPSLLTHIQVHGLRNTNTGTVAPTGTLSIIADTSGGCEPVFGLVFKREQAGLTMYDTDKVFRKALIDSGLTEDEVLYVLDGVAKHHGSLRLFLAESLYLADLTGEVLSKLHALAAYFVVAHDVTVKQHVYMQASFQKFNDSAISKTINFPEDATVEDVEEAYMLAWELGCKGITVYRNNSRQFQPLQVEGKKAVEALPVIGYDTPLHVNDSACPECKQPLRIEEGCEKCSCGFSACGFVPKK